MHSMSIRSLQEVVHLYRAVGQGHYGHDGRVWIEVVHLLILGLALPRGRVDHPDAPVDLLSRSMDVSRYEDVGHVFHDQVVPLLGSEGVPLAVDGGEMAGGAHASHDLQRVLVAHAADPGDETAELSRAAGFFPAFYDCLYKGEKIT